jgi:hypothetical protein
MACEDPATPCLYNVHIHGYSFTLIVIETLREMPNRRVDRSAAIAALNLSEIEFT